MTWEDLRFGLLAIGILLIVMGMSAGDENQDERIEALETQVAEMQR